MCYIADGTGYYRVCLYPMCFDPNGKVLIRYMSFSGVGSLEPYLIHATLDGDTLYFYEEHMEVLTTDEIDEICK